MTHNIYPEHDQWRSRSLTDRLDTVIERSDAERETFIAEIREIWRYLASLCQKRFFVR